MRFTVASLVALAACASAQNTSLTSNLIESLSDKTGVTVFSLLLAQFPTLIDDIIGAKKQNDSDFLDAGVTLLIPDDTAVAAFLEEQNAQPQDLSEALVRSTLSYHVMVKPLKAADFSDPRGLTIPTLLDGVNDQGTSFNLRAPAPVLQAEFGEEATGQVLFAKLDSVEKVIKIKTRQDRSQNTQFQLRSGKAETTNMTVVDGVWAGGVYQIVDA